MSKRITKSNILKLEFDPFQKYSFSRIKTARRCMMAHHYRYYQGLEKKKKGLPLVIGSAIHSVIEAYIEDRDPNVPMEQFRKDFNKLFNEEKAELGDLPTELTGIMNNYFKQYENDGLIDPVRHRGLRSEIPVIVDIDSQSRFVGYVDRFPQDAQGRNWIMDHKSCKSIPKEEARFADYQLLIYRWLLPQLGYPIPDGVIWDYVRKKAPTEPEPLKTGGLSRAAKIDTTYEVYMAAVVKHLGEKAIPEYEEFASTLKGREEKFLRRIYLPNPNFSMVDGVVQDLMSTIKIIREFGPVSTVRSMTKDCSWCSYYTLCQAELRGLDSEYIRKNEYQPKGDHNANNAEEENPESED